MLDKGQQLHDSQPAGCIGGRFQTIGAQQAHRRTTPGKLSLEGPRILLRPARRSMEDMLGACGPQ